MSIVTTASAAIALTTSLFGGGTPPPAQAVASHAVTASTATTAAAARTRQAPSPFTSTPTGTLRSGSTLTLKAKAGYRFTRIDGRLGATTGAVVVKQGASVVGYVDEPLLLDSSTRPGASTSLVKASWRVSSTTLVLDATRVGGPARSLTTTAGFAPVRRASVAFVGIPSNYVYNPALGALHDYCTSSPDSYLKADFRGPCARHDLCFAAAATKSGWDKIVAKQNCNNALYSNLVENCDTAYAAGTLGRSSCRSVAKVYWTAVTAVNP